MSHFDLKGQFERLINLLQEEFEVTVVTKDSAIETARITIGRCVDVFLIEVLPTGSPNITVFDQRSTSKRTLDKTLAQVTDAVLEAEQAILRLLREEEKEAREAEEEKEFDSAFAVLAAAGITTAKPSRQEPDLYEVVSTLPRGLQVSIQLTPLRQSRKWQAHVGFDRNSRKCGWDEANEVRMDLQGRLREIGVLIQSSPFSAPSDRNRIDRDWSDKQVAQAA